MCSAVTGVFHWYLPVYLLGYFRYYSAGANACYCECQSQCGTFDRGSDTCVGGSAKRLKKHTSLHLSTTSISPTLLILLIPLRSHRSPVLSTSAWTEVQLT